MRLLEFESKAILNKHQISTPRGTVFSSSEGLTIKGPVMLKAQIPLGGRGKSGGILEAVTLEEVKAKIEDLLSTKVRGYKPKRILMEEKVEIDQEFFLSITYDTVAKGPVAIFSPEGGVDIEELALQKPDKVRKELQKPDKVRKELFSARTGLRQHRAREIISETGISGKLLLKLGVILSKLADVFLDYDATVAEINPLALTKDGQLIALDCHLDIDDDATFRHKEFEEIEKDLNRVESSRSMSEFERKAAEIDNLDHRGVAGRVIEFDGTLGLIIGGGGASLTAFDAVQAHGGKPANYCEIGGNPSVLKVKELTKL
ncbi:MAG: acetate--CoA ligase family protein, partial [Deltaproteobacteria bacterium]|nr:acetate--CoA ligase family protein [Deltaproteobacteria bacterium]